MQAIRINRNLLKLVYRFGQGDIESYRLYVIARAHFSHCCGLFSLDELFDILHSQYDYKSLHRQPGNKRSTFRKRYANILGSSFLFRHAPDGRYILNSERKLLNSYKGSTKSSWYELPSNDILATKRNFSDFCIGSLLSGNKFRANKNIARFCGCTVRRIQFATARNHRSESFIKQYNFIDYKSGSYKAIERERAILLNVHGITSPLPYRYKDEWVLRLNAPNSYRCLVMSGVKGFTARPTVQVKRMEQCWFRPVRQKDKQLTMFKKDYFKRWIFNESVYDVNRYVQDHSTFLNGGLDVLAS